jgi:hypothetical protein
MGFCNWDNHRSHSVRVRLFGTPENSRLEYFVIAAEFGAEALDAHALSKVGFET